MLENQRFEEITVKSDLYVHRQDGRQEYYSFKTVKPNLDQTETAKRDMLYLKAGNPECDPYFALPFNPAGKVMYINKRIVFRISYLTWIMIQVF